MTQLHSQQYTYRPKRPHKGPLSLDIAPGYTKAYMVLSRFLLCLKQAVRRLSLGYPWRAVWFWSWPPMGRTPQNKSTWKARIDMGCNPWKGTANLKEKCVEKELRVPFGLLGIISLGCQLARVKNLVRELAKINQSYLPNSGKFPYGPPLHARQNKTN